MDLTALIADFAPLDWAAFAYLIAGWLAVGYLTENPPARYPSVSLLMQDYRRKWMEQFITRQPRIFDATILDSLRQGTSFFASACMIAIGGGVAFVGNPERFSGLSGNFHLLPGPSVVWQVKIILVVLFLTNAMLKFVWSHRLFGYCSILMAAVPNDPDASHTRPAALQAAEINILAARNFNKGLRSIYFSLAALGWLLGPVALILAATATIYVSWRREFASHSRRVLLNHGQ